eukprot:scaffold2636_cov340-Pavlova_lutheri.AAC.107
MTWVRPIGNHSTGMMGDHLHLVRPTVWGHASHDLVNNTIIDEQFWAKVCRYKDSPASTGSSAELVFYKHAE